MWRATLMEQHAGGFGVHTPFHFGWSDGTLQDHSTGTMTDQYPPPQNPNTETCTGRVTSQYLHLHSSNTSLSTRRTAGHYHYQWNPNFGTSTTMATSQYPNSQFPTTDTSTREINDQNPYPLHPNTGTETETITFQNPHPQHPITSKTTKRTTSNQTSYWNPTYQGTSLRNPSHQETSYRNPSYQDTSYQNPSSQNASLRNPSYQDTSYQNPRYQDASLRRYQDASYRNPSHQDSSYQNPSHQDASYQNPSHQDASYWNPSHQDASFVNPSAGTSASMTIPAIAPTPRIPARTPRGTPATWTRTPERLSPGQQTSVSSQATSTRIAEHRPWWLLACTPIPLPEQPLSNLPTIHAHLLKQQPATTSPAKQTSSEKSSRNWLPNVKFWSSRVSIFMTGRTTSREQLVTSPTTSTNWKPSQDETTWGSSMSVRPLMKTTVCVQRKWYGCWTSSTPSKRGCRCGARSPGWTKGQQPATFTASSNAPLVWQAFLTVWENLGGKTWWTR